MCLSLADLQKRFVASTVLSPVDPILINEISLNRFDCYRNNFRVGLAKALAETYPVCCRLVGEKFFRATAFKYIETEVSTSFSLNDYGSTFARFLLNFAPTAELQYLPDVADLEWKLHRILIGPENKRFDFEKLSKVSEVDQPNIVFQLGDNISLFESIYPIDQIWDINQQAFSEDIEVIKDNYIHDHNDGDAEPIIDLEQGGCRLLLLRQGQGFDLRLDKLSDNEWTILKMIELGRPLKFLNSLNVESKEIIHLLPNLIERGYISDFYIL